MKTFREQAIPGFSLFAMNTQTHEVKESLKSDYSLDDIAKGIKHSYEYKTDGTYIFLQAHTLRDARRKFNKYIIHVNKKHNEKEKSNQDVQNA